MTSGSSTDERVLVTEAGGKTCDLPPTRSAKRLADVVQHLMLDGEVRDERDLTILGRTELLVQRECVAA